MGLEFVNPENAPAPAANYSNLAIVPAGYRLLVIAGQIGNLSDGSIVDGLEAQYCLLYTSPSPRDLST